MEGRTGSEEAKDMEPPTSDRRLKSPQSRGQARPHQLPGDSYTYLHS